MDRIYIRRKKDGKIVFQKQANKKNAKNKRGKGKSEKRLGSYGI